MAELITLDYLGALEKGYHIALLGKTKKDNQSHYHDYYQVCYVLAGEVFHTQEGAAVRMGAGDAFIVPPGFIHSLHFSGDRTRMYSLAFSEQIFRAGFSQSGAFRFLRSLQEEQESVRLRVHTSDRHRELMEKLLACLTGQQDMDTASALSAAPELALAIVYLLAQCYYLQPQNADKLNAVTAYSGDMRSCVTYIDNHYREKLSLGEVAKQFGISQSAFCSIFPQFAGMPLKKYVASKRVVEAQILIRSHPEWSLERIAGEVGYEEASTFYRNFLKITGVSPSAYRKMQKR